jgi:hypothetical protein
VGSSGGEGEAVLTSPSTEPARTATVALAALSFVLLLAGLWTGDWGSEAIWRAWGCASVLAVAAAHAGAVLGARRSTDTDGVRSLVSWSIGLALADTAGALLPIVGIVDDVGEGAARLFAAVLVLLVLTTVLPPILRRLQPDGAARGKAVDGLAAEVVKSAERIERLAADPALRTPEIRREAERLRNLARSFQA